MAGLLEKLKLKYSPEVYEPAEDSEMLADVVAAERGVRGSVLEIGTGSGVQAIAAALKPGVDEVIATDVNKAALKLAAKNARANGVGVAKKISFVESDLFKKVKAPKGGFDCVIFNPPYLPTADGEKVRGELNAAFDGGGAHGRSVTDRFLRGVAGRGASRFVKPGGTVLLVQSSLSDYGKTVAWLEKNGFTAEIAASRRFFFEEIIVVKAILVGKRLLKAKPR